MPTDPVADTPVNATATVGTTVPTVLGYSPPQALLPQVDDPHVAPAGELTPVSAVDTEEDPADGIAPRGACDIAEKPNMAYAHVPTLVFAPAAPIGYIRKNAPAWVV